MATQILSIFPDEIKKVRALHPDVAVDLDLLRYFISTRLGVYVYKNVLSDPGMLKLFSRILLATTPHSYELMVRIMVAVRKIMVFRF